jgi:beta-glucosidase
MANLRQYTHHVSFTTQLAIHPNLTSGTAEGTGIGGWSTAYAKAKSLVAQMTLEEKVRSQQRFFLNLELRKKQSNMTYGTSLVKNGCSGNIPPIPRLKFPGLCLSDAGNGLRGTDFVNSYPSGIHVGAR